MRKKLTTLFLAAALATSMCMTSFAGAWEQTGTDWKYADNGTYMTGWQWIDGKCYYFDGNGYMAKDTVIDGYTLNEDGQWVVNGIVQTQQVDPHINPINVETSNVTGNEVTDGKSVAQITLNQELTDMMEPNGLNMMPDKTKVADGYFGPIYVTNYKGTQLKFETVSSSNRISDFTGITSSILNNIPESGIELNAFYSNTGYENADGGRKTVASTGRSDQIFGLATGTYRMTRCNIDNFKYHIEIVLTQGTDGNWYIYPNSAMYIQKH